MGVWVFEVPGDAPIHVIIEDGRDEVLRIVVNPGCPVGALPMYHLNRVTGAPDMVLFPAQDYRFLKVSTRNPVAVARALFEKIPRFFRHK